MRVIAFFLRSSFRKQYVREFFVAHSKAQYPKKQTEIRISGMNRNPMPFPEDKKEAIPSEYSLLESGDPLPSAQIYQTVESPIPQAIVDIQRDGVEATHSIVEEKRRTEYEGLLAPDSTFPFHQDTPQFRSHLQPAAPVPQQRLPGDRNRPTNQITKCIGWFDSVPPRDIRDGGKHPLHSSFKGAPKMS